MVGFARLKTLTTQLSTAMQNEHYDDAEKFMAELNKWKAFRTGRAQHDEEVRRLKAARAEVRWRAKNRTRFAERRLHSSLRRQA